MRGRFWRGSMWRWSLDIATLARAARPGDRTSGARGDPQPSPVPTKGSRHPDRRRRPLLRGRAGVQSLGPCEGMASLQDAPARAERTSGLAAFARRHGVSALLEGGDPTAGIAAEPSLRGRDPCRVSASHRHAPLHPRLVRRKSVASARTPASGASRERRPRDRPPGAPSEGMASHSGADHARDDHEGSAQAGFSRSNADRGCTPSAEEDRGLVWVCPCVENVRQKSEVRLQPRRCVRLTSPYRTVTTRGQGLALREHLVRTSVSTSLESRREFRWRRRGVPRFRRVSRPVTPRGVAPPQGGRRSGHFRWKASWLLYRAVASRRRRHGQPWLRGLDSSS